jgi:hypothetical protein
MRKMREGRERGSGGKCALKRETTPTPATSRKREVWKSVAGCRDTHPHHTPKREGSRERKKERERERESVCVCVDVHVYEIFDNKNEPGSAITTKTGPSGSQ